MASKRTPLFQGTIAQVADVLTINGHGVNQPQLSMLCNLFGKSFAEKVGEVRQPGKGRPAAVYNFYSGAPLKVGVVEGTEIKDVDANEFASWASATGKGILVEA